MLNIAQEGCSAITMREVEAVFHNVKCVTDNKSVKETALYHPSRYFILGEEPLENLPAFLEMPFVPFPEEELWKMRFDRAVEEKYFYRK